MREVPCPGGMMASMEDFEINGMIRLGQFLDGAQRSSPVLLAEFPQVAGSG